MMDVCDIHPSISIIQNSPPPPSGVSLTEPAHAALQSTPRSGESMAPPLLTDGRSFSPHWLLWTVHQEEDQNQSSPPCSREAERVSGLTVDPPRVPLVTVAAPTPASPAALGASGVRREAEGSAAQFDEGLRTISALSSSEHFEASSHRSKLLTD